MSAEEMKQMLATAERMAAAAEAMHSAVARIEAAHAEISERVERIVAAVEENQNKGSLDFGASAPSLGMTPQQQVPRRSAPRDDAFHSAGRKTIDPLIGVLLAKSGVETDKGIEAAALDASLATLPVEQRIAVKMQLSRAGLLA